MPANKSASLMSSHGKTPRALEVFVPKRRKMWAGWYYFHVVRFTLAPLQQGSSDHVPFEFYEKARNLSLSSIGITVMKPYKDL
jgi:hypothetical protein